MACIGHVDGVLGHRAPLAGIRLAAVERVMVGHPVQITARLEDGGIAGYAAGLQVQVLQRVLGTGRVEIARDEARQRTALADQQLDQRQGIGRHRCQGRTGE